MAPIKTNKGRGILRLILRQGSSAFTLNCLVLTTDNNQFQSNYNRRKYPENQLETHLMKTFLSDRKKSTLMGPPQIAYGVQTDIQKALLY